MQLTKTSFMHGTQCQKRLWLSVLGDVKPTDLSPGQQRIIDQGNQVGELARRRFPGGVLIREHGAAALAATRNQVELGVEVLFEAAFLYDNVLVRCDILQRTPSGGWRIIEVKGSTREKTHHIQDLAVQRYVLEGVGLAVEATELMLVNNKTCTFPDLTSLLRRVDVSVPVAEALPTVAQRVETFATLLQSGTEPMIEIGGHCSSPHGCPFTAHCWANVPSDSIWHIPRMQATRKSRLYAEGIRSVKQLPAEESLSARQQRYVAAVRRGQPYVDVPGIRARLRQLRFPLYFLDFETDAPAIPRFDGMRPYEQIPFQYSLHVMTDDGTVRHTDYLHTEQDDPSEALLHALHGAIGDEGSIVVYNAQFERQVLRRLGERFPQHAQRLESMIARLWDQLKIFDSHYCHPATLGSSSIKRILTVVAPELSYEGLAVAKGDDAQAVWAQMVQTADSAAKEEMIRALRDYCTLDTFAMVRIHERLCEITAGEAAADDAR